MDAYWTTNERCSTLYVDGWRVGACHRRAGGWGHGMRGQVWPTREAAMEALAEREVGGPMVAPVESAPRIDRAKAAAIAAALSVARDDADG